MYRQTSMFLPSLQALHQSLHRTLPAADPQTHHQDPLPVAQFKQSTYILIYIFTAMWKLY